MFFLLYADVDDPMEETIDDDAKLKNEQPEMSLDALSGHSSPQTMWINSCIKRLSVVNLIDSSSTHNYVDPKVAKRIGFWMQVSDLFNLMVANVKELSCRGKCPNMRMTMQGYWLHIDMYVIPIGGCNVVLDAQWL